MDRRGLIALRPVRPWMLALLVLLTLGLRDSQAAGSQFAIAVVVGRGQAPMSPLTPSLVAGIFARKRLLWHDRSPIQPVNLPATHPLRRQFSLLVFERTPEEMQDYWNDQYFHGVVPPPVLASEEAVLRFVAATSGAVGYVSVCSVDPRVFVVATLQPPDGSAACSR